jgi:hypothetical protein
MKQEKSMIKLTVDRISRADLVAAQRVIQDCGCTLLRGKETYSGGASLEYDGPHDALTQVRTAIHADMLFGFSEERI